MEGCFMFQWGGRGGGGMGVVFQMGGFIFKGGTPWGGIGFGGGGGFKKIIRWGLGRGQMCNPTTDSFVSTLVLSIAMEHFISAKHYSIY